MSGRSRLRIATHNFREGLLDEGVRGERWKAEMELVTDLRLDLLFVQELHGWDRDGGELRFRAEEELSMRALIAPAPMLQCHLGILFDPRRVRPMRWDRRLSGWAWHAFGRATLRVDGLPGPLTAVAMHLSPWSGEQRLIEGAVMARHVGSAEWGILAGDANCVPPGDPEPPWDKMPLRKRATLGVGQDGIVRADRRVGELWEAAGLIDAARQFAGEVGAQPTATGEWHRCDQIWLTPSLAKRLVTLETVETGWSDHRLIWAELEVGP